MKCGNLVSILGCGAAMACGSAAQQPQGVAATSACDRLQDTTLAMAALYEPGSVYTATKAEEALQIGRASVPVETVGAELGIHAQPGLDQTYIERVLRCHAASGRATHPSDPLVLDQGRVTDITVRSAGDRLAVRIVGDSRAAADEIWRRARAFAAASGTVSVHQLAAIGIDTNRL